MEHLFYQEYRKLYDQGYTFGLNPVFANFEDLNLIAPNQRNSAFINGFRIGRTEYEKLNGRVADGIPAVVLTERILLGFRIDAQLGIPLQADKFNSRQTEIIRQHYESGAKRYDLSQHLCLYKLLAENEIGVLPSDTDY
ncbi:MAG TPA: hypothetical protein VF676_02825 [Flavobacterium sp.]|jgi:hypothetical protein